MGVGAGLYMYDVVVKKGSRSLSHCFVIGILYIVRNSVLN